MSAFKKVTERSTGRVVLVEGLEGTGKTHFAVNGDGPIYLLGTEGGHETDTAIRVNPEVLHAEVYSKEDLSPAKVWFGKSFGMWRKFTDAVNETLKMQPGTVVIDSASDMYPAVVAGLSEEMKRGDKPVPPLLYGQIYSMMTGLIHSIRARHNVVLTARLKPRYDKDGNETGALRPEIWKTCPYLAEHVVRIVKTKSGTRVGYVTKGPFEGRVMLNPTLAALLTSDETEMVDSQLFRDLQSRLVRAYEVFDKVGLEVEQEYPVKPEEANALLTDLRSQIATHTKKGQD